MISEHIPVDRLRFATKLLSLACVAALLPLQGKCEENTIARLLPACVVIEARAPGGGGQGSGFIVHETGKIVTCFHVVRGAATIRVKLSDGAVLPVKGLLAYNEKNDVAVLKVDGSALPTVQLAAQAPRAGDAVTAIASPKGFENTVSTGVCSAIRNPEDLPESYQNALVRDTGHRPASRLIQYTAPTQHGSSGGALFDASGQVVGIIALGGTGADNAYFAIPVEVVRPLLASETVIPLDDPDLKRLPPTPSEGAGPDFGLEESKAFTYTTEVPKSAPFEIRLPAGLLIDRTTVKVSTSANKAMAQGDGDLEKGQFAVPDARSLRFSKGDAKQKVTIRADARAKRIVLLPVGNGGSYEDLPGIVQERLSQEISSRCYTCLAGDEVRKALEELSISVDAIQSATGGAIGAPDANRLCEKLRARELVLARANAQDFIGANAYMAVAVSLLVWDASTSKVIADKFLTKNERVRLRAFSKTRRSLAESLASSAVDQAFGPARLLK